MNRGSVALWLALTACFFFGCSKKGDVPAEPPASDSSDSTPAENPAPNPENVVTFDEVLATWSNGQQMQAAEQFQKIQWDGAGIFASESVFQMSEAQFVKLPASRRETISQQALDLSKQIKMLTKFIIEEARQKGHYEATREALIACGKRLSQDDQLLLIQMVGKAVAEYTEKELPVW